MRSLRILFLPFLLPVPTMGQGVLTGAGTQMDPDGHLLHSARSAVFGEAFAGVSGDGPSFLLNPAGLRDLSQGQVSLHTYTGPTLAVNGSGLLAVPLGPWGAAALGLGYTHYGAMDGYDIVGLPEGTYGAERLTGQAGLGIGLLKGLSGGLSLGYSRLTLDGTSYAFLSPEVGFHASGPGGLSFGLDYRYSLTLEGGEEAVSSLRAGAAWDLPLEPSFKLLALLGGALRSSSQNLLRAGLEATFVSHYRVRVGYALHFQPTGNDPLAGLSLGAGLTLEGLTLDYAFLPQGDMGASHRVSLSYPFQVTAQGPSKAEGVPATGSVETDPPSADSRPTNVDPAKAGPAKVDPAKADPAKAGPANVEKGDPGRETLGSSPLLDPAKAQVPPPLPKEPVTPKDASTAAGDKPSLTLEFDIPTDFVAQAEEAEAQGRSAAAVAAYQQAIEQDARNFQAWYKLGSLYAKQGQRTEAIRCLEKALALRPDHRALKDWLEKYKSR